MIKLLVLSACLSALAITCGTAAEKAPARKLTCCEEAKAASKECTHKCCITAHKDGKSCEKCNPGKEDLKLLKKETKPPQKKPA